LPRQAYPSFMNQAKKRIAIMITLAEQGGAQHFVTLFAEKLIASGHEVTVYAGSGTWLADALERRHIPFKRIPHLSRDIRIFDDIRVILWLRKELKQQRVDALHLNSTKMSIVGSIAGRLAKTPRIVYRIGGWVFLERLSPLKKNIYKWLEIWTAKNKDVIVCVHPGDVEVAKRVGIKPKKEVIAIPNGVQLAKFDQNLKPWQEARTLLHLPNNAPIFGTVANFFPAKQLDRYMNACRRVANELPGAKFVLLGDGREYANIEERRKSLGLEDAVILAGECSNASELLKAFDVFVLPSAKEGMSWALLEAMAAALPCVATNVGAASWMFEDDKGGWLASPQDMNEVADAMLAAYASLPENEKGKRARVIIEMRFPLSKTLELSERSLVG